MGDGDLDVVISRREPKTAYWFEREERCHLGPTYDGDGRGVGQDAGGCVSGYQQ